MNEKKSLDKAFKQFHAKKYKESIVSFELLLGNVATGLWVRSRIEQFKLMAQRRLQKNEEDPIALRHFSFHFNLGEFDKAAEILPQLELSDNDRSFLDAELHIEQDKKEEAIGLLKQAIELDEHNLGYALNSPSFADHILDADFAFLRTGQDDA